jgi:hypothetical protein
VLFFPFGDVAEAGIFFPWQIFTNCQPKKCDISTCTNNFYEQNNPNLPDFCQKNTPKKEEQTNKSP